jgi:hypothetical protein
MKRPALCVLIRLLIQFFLIVFFDSPAHAWVDETHIAVAKVAGYPKYFNACGQDMIKDVRHR